MKLSDALKQGRSERMRRVTLAHIGTPKQCKAIRNTGEQCRRKVVKGGTVCIRHGGYNQSKRIEREATEAKIRKMLGIPLVIEPGTALLQSVHEAAGNVAILRSMVQELEARPAHGRAIYGPDHLGDMAPHVLVKLYNEERDRLAKLAKMAVDAGIAERQVRLVEQQGAIIVNVIVGVLEDPRLKLSREIRMIGRKVASERLREVALIESGEDHGNDHV